MENDIYNFLPMYNETDKVDYTSLNSSINNKKEFLDLKLSKYENYPTSPGVPLMNQKFLARLVSQNTPYDELLIYHSMGSGKTCAVINIIETIKNSKSALTGSNMTFKKALILTKGVGIIENFKKELVEKCTAGAYFPENHESLNHPTLVKRTNALIGKFYKFSTFQKFAGKILKAKERIIDYFSDTIVVIDEVHNIRENKKEEILVGSTKTKVNVYNTIKHFLSEIKNRKIILLSGTPMVDKVNEIASVMNLILPPDNNFRSTKYEDFISLSDTELKNKFKGRISYLNSTTSTIAKNYNGEILGNLKFLKVVPDRMSKHQSKYFFNIWTQEQSSNSFYINSRQSSLMVFPDGQFGSEGYTTYIKNNPKEFINYINKNGSDTQSKLNQVYNLSSKYKSSIENILASVSSKKLVFVYMDFVYGSGAFVFAKLLEQFGFSQFKLNDQPSASSLKYTILTHKITTENTKKIIDVFNRKENMNGDYINVIIGSKIIGEGFTFKNVQVVEILTPHWNLAETDQAISRGYRFGSHRDLTDCIAGSERAGCIDISYDIFLRVSLSEQDKSCDLNIYEIAEQKDIEIKKIERLIKEVSIDCYINYDRNIRDSSLDGTRDCEYKVCDYKCDGNIEGAVDSSTYDLFYIEENRDAIINFIKLKFKEKSKLNFGDFNPSGGGGGANVKGESNFKILHYLNELISRNVKIENKYGVDCFIREINNVYFLIDDGNFNADPLLSFYSKYPSLSDEVSFGDAMAIQYKKFSVDIISKIFSEKDPMFYMQKLYPIDQQYVLEACVLQRHTKHNSIPKSVAKILEHNKYFWIEKEEYYLVILANFIDSKNKVSYMAKSDGPKSPEWKRSEEVDNLYKNYIKTIKDKDFYGLITIINDIVKFKLVNRTKEYNKKNKNIKTQVCETIEKTAIRELIVGHILPQDLIESNENFIDLQNIIKDGRYNLKLLQKFIADTNKKLMCTILENYLLWSGNILIDPKRAGFGEVDPTGPVL